MNNNLKITSIIAATIAATILIIFFSYFLFFSPLAQCVSSLQKISSIETHHAKLECMSRFLK